jgi:prophage antirepressor-like protein
VGAVRRRVPADADGGIVHVVGDVGSIRAEFPGRKEFDMKPKRKTKSQDKRPVQIDLWGQPIEEPEPSREGAIIPLDFQSNAVRMIVCGGEPVFILHDPARILGYESAKDASRLIKDKYLSNPVTRRISPSLQLRADTILVSEPGLYLLLARSNHPKAEEFQDWLFEEVLPTIRRTGSYSLPLHGRVVQLQKKLGCDMDTAMVRHDQLKFNKEKNRRLAEEGAQRRDFANYHNAGYEGLFGDGMTAGKLRQLLGLKDYETPLDHMGYVPLSVNHLAKAIANKLMEDKPEPITPDRQAEILKETARAVMSDCLERLGSEYEARLIEHMRRGKLLDVIRTGQALNGEMPKEDGSAR